MILYFKKNSVHGLRLRAALAEVYSREKTAICHSLRDALFSAVRPVAVRDIVVLLAEDQAELAGLSAYGSQLREHNLILILPNKETDNLVAGCVYQPKYMAEVNGDFIDVQNVIRKMTTL